MTSEECTQFRNRIFRQHMITAAPSTIVTLAIIITSQLLLREERKGLLRTNEELQAAVQHLPKRLEEEKEKLLGTFQQVIDDAIVSLKENLCGN